MTRSAEHTVTHSAARSDATGEEVVLVVADDTDTTADDVCAVLADQEVPYFRFDTATFPGRLALDTRLERRVGDGQLGATVLCDNRLRIADQSRWAGTLRRVPGEVRHGRDRAGLNEVDLTLVRSVYLRRPRPFEVPAHLSAPERWHAATECRYGLGGVLASLPVPYLNHPSASADAAYKPRQLADLAACGLRVPPTLVTNSGDAVRAFADRHGQLICKSLAAAVLHVGEVAHVLYTRPVTAADLDALSRAGSGIDWAAHLFQPFLPSTHAMRLIVVGDRMFAVRIDAHSDRARMDWRADYNHLAYRLTTLPEHVTAGVRAYMRRAKLHYGAWDFLGHADGSFTALEYNPEGNYAWLEDVTPARITTAIASFLADPHGHGASAPHRSGSSVAGPRSARG